MNRPEGLITREVDGEVLILDERASLIHKLNSTASFIWQRCKGEATAESIAAELVGQFSVDPKKALSDVTKTLVELRSLGLLAES